MVKNNEVFCWMEILFKNKIAEQQFNSKHRRKWKYPVQVIEKLVATENFIQQAASMQDIFQYPPFRFHALKGDRKHEWSIRLGGTGYRVTIIPCSSDGFPIRNGDILAQSKTIISVMVTEVSNHYE